MKIAGIVCEYNPMHNGHVYQIEQTRLAGATHIVCAMSGNFVQRGECAFLDKWTRADIAVHCGADLVIDLPTPWSCDSAPNFAFGAVSMLGRLNIDMLSFGCETDDEKLLKKCACLEGGEFSEEITQRIKAGDAYPAALHYAVSKLCSKEQADIVAAPNNTLAVEYIKALNRLGSKAEILLIKRLAVGHDELSPLADMASAAAIRAAQNIEQIEKVVPQYAYKKMDELFKSGEAPARMEFAQRAVLSHLRTMTKEQMSLYTDEDRGLSDRIYLAVRSAQSLSQLYALAKTKNTTMAKVRRTVLRMYLGITSDISKNEPPYIKVLAANEKGLEIIKNADKSASVVSRHSDFASLSDFSKAVYATECRCSDLYALFCKKIKACSSEQTSPVLIIR